MIDSQGLALNRENMILLEEELQNNGLYRIYILCPLMEKYYQVDNPGGVTLLDGFLDYFNQAMQNQDVFFAEDEPRKYHHFAQSDDVMFELLVPADLVVCINGHLMLKPNEIILESILGIYLFNDSDQFFTNSAFHFPSIKAWLAKRKGAL